MIKTQNDAAGALIAAGAPEDLGCTFDLMFDAGVARSHLSCYHDHSRCMSTSCEGIRWHLELALRYLDTTRRRVMRHLDVLR